MPGSLKCLKILWKKISKISNKFHYNFSSKSYIIQYNEYQSLTFKMEKDNNQTESIRETKPAYSEEVSTSIIEDLKKVPRGTHGFVVIKGPNIGAKFFLSKDKIQVGRSPESDIFLDDITVSRQHAVLEKTKQGFKIIDAESLNGTYVNGQRADDVPLENGARIQIGKYVFLYFTL